jgi:hypothetical protein
VRFFRYHSSGTITFKDDYNPNGFSIIRGCSFSHTVVTMAVAVKEEGTLYFFRINYSAETITKIVGEINITP